MQLIRDLRRLIAIFALIATAASLAGCLPIPNSNLLPAQNFGPGATFTTLSGLTLTVPPGANASKRELSPGEVDPAVPFTEMFYVRSANGTWSVSFLSFRHGGRNRNSQKEVARSADGSVVVLEPQAQSLPAVVETDLHGAAQGRIVITVDPAHPLKERGLALAQLIWKKLNVRGASLP